MRVSRNLGPDGATAALRRVIIGALAAVADPTLATQGISVQGEHYINVTSKATVATFDMRLWVYFENPGIWTLDADYGTRTIITTSIDVKNIDVRGVSRAYLQCQNFAAGAVADAWVDGITL